MDTTTFRYEIINIQDMMRKEHGKKLPLHFFRSRTKRFYFTKEEMTLYPTLGFTHTFHHKKKGTRRMKGTEGTH